MNTGRTHFKKGYIPWIKGRKMPYIPHPGHLGKLANEKHPLWKGNSVGYRAIHYWIRRKLGKPIKCSNNINHKSTRYHWANISGEYKRDLTDWRELCPSCNMKEAWVKRKRGMLN